MPKRTILFAGIAVMAVPLALLLAEPAGPAGFPAAVAGSGVVAMVFGWPAGQRYAHLLAIAGGSASLVVTGYLVVSGTTVEPAGRNLGAVELIGLYLIIAAVARWTVPLRVAILSGGVAWAACIVWLLRSTEESQPLVILSNLVAASVFPTAAAVAGGLPRFLAYRRVEVAAAARREQRLELAQDLHDFVAHDLTGIVAQAQAVRFARGNEVGDLQAALERIEAVGLAALDTMDGFVQVLHTGAAPRSNRGIADLPGLVDRFRAEREPDSAVTLELDDRCTALPWQLQATAYRVVVEGLTNVRRHAGPGCVVAVSVTANGNGNVIVTVTNDLDSAPSKGPGRSFAGTGLGALEDRVSAVGGRLESGPDDAGRWRLAAIVPEPEVKDGRQ